MRRPAETHQPQHNVGTRRGVTTSPLRVHVDHSVARKEAKSQRRLARFARAEHTTLKKPCGGGGGTWALETSAVRASIALKQEARRAGAAAAANRWDWAAVHVRGAPTSRHANDALLLSIFLSILYLRDEAASSKVLLSSCRRSRQHLYIVHCVYLSS